MDVHVEFPYALVCELRPQPDLAAMPLSSELCTVDVGQLIDEVYTRAGLAERWAAEPDALHVRIEPVFKQEPLVERLRIMLTTRHNGDPQVITDEFRSGPWVRRAQNTLLDLKQSERLAADAVAYRMLLALPDGKAQLRLPPLQAPVIQEIATLAACGVRQLGEGSLDAERPVLVNQRFVEDGVRMCEEADVQEAGGAALGRLVRLAQPLPGTTTRIVTVLSAIVADVRHQGTETRFHFSPEGLAEAQRMCDLRGLGEQVITVFHTHGWSNRCGNCNQNAACPLTESFPSVHDYEQLLDQLFPAKSTLLPIAGRKLGAVDRRPVLQVHGWQGGQMQPILWQTYRD